MFDEYYLHSQFAARAKDRGYKNIEHGIYEMACEYLAAQIKPYVDMKIRVMSLTPKVMVFTQDGHQLTNDYPEEVRFILHQCDHQIAQISKQISAALKP